MSTTVIDRVIGREIDALHDSYVEAVNVAIADDDLARAEELASRFDEDTLDVFVRHGRIAPLPTTVRPSSSAVRRLVERLSGSRAA